MIEGKYPGCRSQFHTVKKGGEMRKGGDDLSSTLLKKEREIWKGDFQGGDHSHTVKKGEEMKKGDDLSSTLFKKGKGNFERDLSSVTITVPHC